MITQSYKLNIVPHAEQNVRGFIAPVVHESQYDTGMRTLIFTLYKEGELYTILEGQTVSLFGTKPDGNAFEYSMTIVDTHTVSIVDNIQMTCVAGLVTCEIVVFGTQNDRIGSANFVLCIEPAAVDADQVLSDTDIPVFNEILYGGEVGEILTKTTNGAEWAPQGTGTGYMIKAEYDPNDTGSVLKADHADDAGTVDGHTVARNVLDDEYTNSEIDTLLSGKVSTEAGKGLSTNDFTDALETKLAGIETGAEVNVQSDWDEADNMADSYIQNKPSIPSKVSDLQNDSGFITGVDWGDIGGTLADQTDLKNALDAKQGTLTAGTGITINDNVISATGGGGSGGHVIVNSSGTDMTQRAKLKFDGATVTDDAVNDMTIVSGLKGDQGDPGDPGTAATIAVGTVTSGQTASVTNSGTSSAAVFDFVLPKGDQGDPGTPGQDGQDGAAATIAVGTVTSGQTASVTNSGTSSAAVFDFVLPKGDPGQNGQDGTDGTDGVSPTVSTTAITGGTEVTITDADGPHVFDVMDGTDGQDGAPGQDGTDGTDGFSPTVSTSSITGGTEVTITDVGGPHTFNVMDGTNGAPGADGSDGADGFSPIVATSTITGGTEVTITDSHGPHVFNVMDGADGQTGQTGPAGADGYSPTATVTKTGSTVTITITDKNGTTTATVTDGADAQDVTTTFTISTSGWSNSQTLIDGEDYYTYTINLTEIHTEAPIISIGASGTLPTAAEQEAYDAWQYATVNDQNDTLTLYATSKPTSNFKIIVKGVE